MFCQFFNYLHGKYCLLFLPELSNILSLCGILLKHLSKQFGLGSSVGSPASILTSSNKGWLANLNGGGEVWGTAQLPTLQHQHLLLFILLLSQLLLILSLILLIQLIFLLLLSPFLPLFLTFPLFNLSPPTSHLSLHAKKMRILNLKDYCCEDPLMY